MGDKSATIGGMAERTPWMVEKIRQHPNWAAAGAVFTLIGGAATIWNWFDDRPFFRALWETGGALMSGHLWVVAGAILILASFVLVFGMAVAIARGNSRVESLEGQQRSSREALRRTTEERDEARSELAEAASSLRKTKELFAHERLRIYSGMRFGRSGEITPVVTIRFADYAGGDYALAKRIEEIFNKYTSWPVTLDGSNSPVLNPAGDFKVIFESSAFQDFDRVAFAFSDGDLLRVSVGSSAGDRTDQHHLVVKVFPSAY